MALNALMSLGGAELWLLGKLAVRSGFWGNWQFGQEKWYFRKLMGNFNL
jgi:hypothetical protein